MGALGRAAPFSVARPFSKPSRGGAPAACGAMAATWESSTGRAGAKQKLAVPSPKYTKVVRNGVVVEMEVIPVVVCGEGPNARPIVKPPPRVVETSTCGEMVREKKSVHRAGAEEQVSLPSPKRTKVTREAATACRAGTGGLCVTKKEIVNAVQVQVEVIPAGGKKPLYSAPGHLRGVLGRDPSVCLAAAEVFSFSVPTRKRTRSNVEAEAEVVTVGGEKPVDPALDRLHKRMASELEALRDLLKKAELIPSRPACTSKRLLPPEHGGKTPSLKRRKVALSAEPRKMVQDAQRAAAPKAAVCLSGVLFRAKVRQELLKMERAVLPNESINQRDLQRLSIAEYGRPSVMRQLGLFLIKADA